MDTGELLKTGGDTRVAELLDNLLDTVLALKARLRDSNRDSNSLGGILIPPQIPEPAGLFSRAESKLF